MSNVVKLITSNDNLEKYMENNPDAISILKKYFNGDVLTLKEKKIMARIVKNGVKDGIYNHEKRKIKQKKKRTR